VADPPPAHLRLKGCGGERLQRPLAKAKERPYYKAPVPVAEYGVANSRLAVR
jgi:hypothetical protein